MQKKAHNNTSSHWTTAKKNDIDRKNWERNLKEHVECSEKHFPWPEQVEDVGGGSLLFHNHVLADGSGLHQVFWNVSSVALGHSLCFNFRLPKFSRLPLRSLITNVGTLLQDDCQIICMPRGLHHSLITCSKLPEPINHLGDSGTSHQRPSNPGRGRLNREMFLLLASAVIHQ